MVKNLKTLELVNSVVDGFDLVTEIFCGVNSNQCPDSIE